MRTPAPGTAGAFDHTSAFRLEPLHASTARLIVRARYSVRPAEFLFLEPVQVVMERTMLRRIRARAERAANYGRANRAGSGLIRRT